MRKFCTWVLILIFCFAISTLLMVMASSVMWSQTYGGSYDSEVGVLTNDVAYSLVETSEGGYAIAGDTTSFGAGGFDFWLVKTDANGNMEWNQNYGTSELEYSALENKYHEYAYSVVETSDGGFALAGYAESDFHVDSDFWVIKTNAQGIPEFPSWAPLMIMLLLVVAVAVIYRRSLNKHNIACMHS